ncbi:MAG: acyl carrier protein [Planctomycetaceae bacterium]
MAVDEKVFTIVADQLSVSQDEISRESSFIDDLKADSLDVVEMVMEFEDAFDITIPDDDYDKIKTVGDAVDYITEKS